MSRIGRPSSTQRSHAKTATASGRTRSSRSRLSTLGRVALMQPSPQDAASSPLTEARRCSARVTRAALGVPILPRVLRAALFTVTGVLWCASSLLVLLTDADYQHPESAVDWFTVLSFSAALFAVAFALPMLAQLIGGQVVFRVSLVPAMGAILAGLSNLLEDALQLSWAFWLFILGTAVIVVGLVAFTVAIAVAGRGRLRLLAAIPAATLINALYLHEAGGGVLMLAAWLAAAAMVLGPLTHTVARSAPTSP